MAKKNDRAEVLARFGLTPDANGPQPPSFDPSTAETLEASTPAEAAPEARGPAPALPEPAYTRAAHGGLVRVDEASGFETLSPEDDPLAQAQLAEMRAEDARRARAHVEREAQREANLAAFTEAQRVSQLRQEIAAELKAADQRAAAEAFAARVDAELARRAAGRQS